jgi:hypothetical protein
LAKGKKLGRKKPEEGERIDKWAHFSRQTCGSRPSLVHRFRSQKKKKKKKKQRRRWRFSVQATIYIELYTTTLIDSRDIW